MLVQEIINEWDSIRILNMGEPEDEYTPAVKEIAELLSDMKTVDPLSIEIQHQNFVSGLEKV
ncbi:hypothetical protein DVB69_10575 [Sporosarcina sp. BI001-red]|nr:hypothetical protein DVB69_10575 [Sporosarcina sp. BI001-red]